MPRWLRYLKPVLSGMYTADNLDYVLRDAYMCGVAVGPVDLERLLHYSMLTEHGLTLHKAGIGALTMFLQARLYLYTNVYCHRTSRALDLHLREIFAPTMGYLFPGNPLDMLARYQRLTDWSLLETVRAWEDDPLPAKQTLGHAWGQILGREVKWKMAYDATFPVRGFERQQATRLEPEHFVQRIRQALPLSHRNVPFHLDIATQDPRNMNPLSMGHSPIYIYDPTTGKVDTEIVEAILEHIPVRLAQYRVYTTERTCQTVLAQACERALARAVADAPIQKERT
jgi:HD superfamily phosphohydrolase